MSGRLMALKLFPLRTSRWHEIMRHTSPARRPYERIKIVDEFGQEPFAPQRADLDRPSVARIYDYYLGGNTNWAIDREFGNRILADFPHVRFIAKANRQFLFRVVQHLMGLGVRQFIDLGAGLPTMDHVHSVADRFEAGSAKVVYVDNEPVAVAHSKILLEKQGDVKRHAAINADIRDPRRLWRQVTNTGLIDFSQPVALLMIAVLHVQQLDHHGRDIGDQITAHYRQLLPPGSYLAISHGTDEGVPQHMADKLANLKAMYDASSSPVIWRTRPQLAALFDDFDLLEPGLTRAPLWHPEENRLNTTQEVFFDEPNESAIYVGVGRKPAQ